MSSPSASRQATLAVARGLRANAFSLDTIVDARRCRVFDASGEVLGRLASRLAHVLQGKDKPTWRRSQWNGDSCVVVNCGDIALTGRKDAQKMYRRHTGFVGGLKSATAREMRQRDPTFLIRKAVERMLPRQATKQRRNAMRKLRCFPNSYESEHVRAFLNNFEKVKTEEMPPRALRNSAEEEAFRWALENEGEKGGEEEGSEWVAFNPEKREELRKRFERSIAAKKMWRMGMGWIDLDAKGDDGRRNK